MRNRQSDTLAATLQHKGFQHGYHSNHTKEQNNIRDHNSQNPKKQVFISGQEKPRLYIQIVSREQNAGEERDCRANPIYDQAQRCGICHLKVQAQKQQEGISHKGQRGQQQVS